MKALLIIIALILGIALCALIWYSGDTSRNYSVSYGQTPGARYSRKDADSVVNDINNTISSSRFLTVHPQIKGN